MPAIAAANVTVSVNRRDIVRQGRRKSVRGTLTFGDGALTYSTAGIPLPAVSAFGFVRVMESLNIFGVNERTTDYQVRFGPANKTLLLYEEEAAAATGRAEEEAAATLRTAEEQSATVRSDAHSDAERIRTEAYADATAASACRNASS